VSEGIYNLDVLKALVDIEISRIKRYKKQQPFSIAFIYTPNIKDTDIATILRTDLRSSDVIASIEKDFVFVFLPETGKEGAYKFLNRINKKFTVKTVEGVVTYPEDGETSFELFQKLFNVMKEKMLPTNDL